MFGLIPGILAAVAATGAIIGLTAFAIHRINLMDREKITSIRELYRKRNNV